MPSWSARRKFIYMLIFVLLIGVPVIFGLFKLFYVAPTCNDGRKNQGEGGVDCGGPCSSLCRSDYVEPSVLWRRLFNVDKGVYTAVAFVENPNLSAEAQNVLYVFKVYDEDNVLLEERAGRVNIYAKSEIPIIETGISTAEIIPTRVEFDFASDFQWTAGDQKKEDIRVSNQNLTQTPNGPRITANIENLSIEDARNVDVVVIVYDKDGNALGVSKTMIGLLRKDEIAEITFSWPQNFSDEVSKIQFYPRIR